MMANPKSRGDEDNRLCPACGYPFRLHSDEQKVKCSKAIMNKKYGSEGAGIR